MPEISTLEVRPVSEADHADVIRLWESCGLVVSYNPPLADLNLAVGRSNSDVLVGCVDSVIVASVLVGHDGHRGWIYYLAVEPAHQKKGFGALMVRAAEEWLTARDIRKLQLLIRESNTGVMEFYDRLGYQKSGVVVMQRWLDGTAP